MKGFMDRAMAKFAKDENLEGVEIMREGLSYYRDKLRKVTGDTPDLDVGLLLFAFKTMRKKPRERFSPLTGERFGNVTAVELLRVEEVKGKQEEVYRCVCHACGKDDAEFTRFQLLHAGNRKSCGCGQVKMEAGLVINSIEALLPAENSRQWFCRCHICGELILLAPPQFRMSFDREGCSACRERARVKEKTQANKSPYKELQKHTEESRLPVLNSEREIESINSIKEKSRRRGKSYGQYVAGLKPVKVGKAPKGYTSWYERNGIK